MSIKLRYWPSEYGGCCFEIVLPTGKVLVIDPFRMKTTGFENELLGADYIALTHNTHMGVRDCTLLSQKFNGRIICSHIAADIMLEFSSVDWRSNVIPATAGDIITFDDLTVEVKRAQHPPMIEIWKSMAKSRAKLNRAQKEGKIADLGTSSQSVAMALQSRLQLTPEEKKQQKKEEKAMGFSHRGEHLNFVFQTSENVRIYLHQSGTADFLRREITEAHPNIFITQCHPGNDAAQIAECAVQSGAEIIIPYGHQLRDDQPIETMTKYLADKKSQAQLLDIAYKQWYEIGMKVL